MTKGLKVFTSNRLEYLADDLAQLSLNRNDNVFQPEIVMVQSQGMARWLSLHLAERNAICANFRFPFPNAFLHQAFRALSPSLTEQSDSRLEVLVWRVMRHLPGCLRKANFIDLRNYLGQEGDSRKLFQLAQKIGWLFDQYLVFRPELIEEWDNGADNDWQAELWRIVAADFERPHVAALRNEFLKKIATVPAEKLKLPERVSVFGISALPPFHMELLDALGSKIEVNLFLLQPCKEFWGYIAAPREQERAFKKHANIDSQLLHLERGNRLLASTGKLGRDFLNVIFQSDNLTPVERFSEPDETTLLSTIQSDILLLRDRGTVDCPRKICAPEDDSIQIHSCHSPMREMEVLHDCVLGWLEKDPELKPADILVLTPDIETYAPFVQAVFGSAESRDKQIPFSLADRDPRNEGRVLEPFFTLLALSESRLGVVQVLTLLECAAVRQRFSLSESDLLSIRQWVEKANIRWGIDAQHRGHFGVPEFNANSWRQGLDNLLLGYAMGNENEELFGSLLPLNCAEGSTSQTLGSLVDFTEKLFAIADVMAISRTLSEWEIVLRRACSDFFVLDEETEHEIKLIWIALKKLRVNGDTAGFAGKINLAVVVEFLAAELRENVQAAGFLAGGVTFAALKPMRSLPFKIICLAGMNDDSFPRHGSQLAFDLMTKAPRLGDRSTRDDDRYLFLESVLSARQKLHISYVGQSIRDNAARPPSVLVSELTDYITQGFSLPADGSVLQNISKKHRLQAFSESYFNGGELVSYSQENFLASQTLQKRQREAQPFFPAPLTAPEDDWRFVTIDQLVRFFSNPCEFLLTERLGIRLPRQEEEMEEREPFVVDARAAYEIKQTLVERVLAGTAFAKTGEILTASGMLPVGKMGSALFDNLCDEANDFIQRLQPFCPSEKKAGPEFDFSLGEFRLKGQLDGFTSIGLLRSRCAKLKPVDILRLWIPHLIWNKVAPKLAHRAVHVAADETFCLGHIPKADAILAELLELYWEGLRSPAKFFPQSSFVFAEAQKRVAEGNGRVDPRNEARKKWSDATVRDGDGYRTLPGESANPYITLCFGQTEPLDEEFEKISTKVFGPVLERKIALA